MGRFKFECLTKSFKDKVVFSNISHEFNDSGLSILLGESGCGKTTLFHILLGLEKKDNGTIEYDNKTLTSDLDFDLFRSKCAYVFQEYAVLNYLSCKENLNLGGFKINLVDENFISKNNLHKKAGNLSGGEKQRLALFKAINQDPEILFCDEPTGSLDEQNGKYIMEKLKEFSKNRLVIMVSHNIELANIYGDEIIKLENQKLDIIKSFSCNKDNLYISKIKTSYLNGINISCNSFFQNKLHLFFTYISLILSFCSMLLIDSLSYSSIKVIREISMTYVDYNTLQVSEIENKKIEGTSFSLTKTYCPSIDIIENLIESYGYVSFSYASLFQGAKIEINDQKVEYSVIITPFLKEEIAVNNLVYLKHENVFLSITFNKLIESKIENKIVQDTFSYHIDYEVNTIYDEFSFLNYPCIFISEEYLINFIKNIHLKNFSKQVNEKVSIYDRYTKYVTNNDPLTMYQVNINIYNKDDVLKVYNILNNYRINKDNYLQVSSRSMLTYLALSSSFELLNMLTNIFGIISLIITLILLYLIIYTSFQNRKKEFALYKTFGFSNFVIFVYIFIPFILFLLIGLISSFRVFPFIKKYVSDLFFPYFYCDLFKYSSYSFSSIYKYIMLITIIGLIGTLFSLFNIKKLKVNEVIKSE